MNQFFYKRLSIESGVDSTANKASGKINLHSSSCSPSPTSLQTYPKGSNKESSIKKVIPSLHSSFGKSERGDNLVDGKSSSSQFQITSRNFPESNDKFRCLKDRMGAACQGMSTGGPWTWQEAEKHINILELKAALLAIQTYVPIRKPTSIHLQLENTTVLAYLMKMGGTKNLELINLSQEIWNYLLDGQIMITLEYLPGVSNIIADTESRVMKDFSEWKLNRKYF